MSAYITGVGSYLPGEPIGNDEIETYLGKSSGSDRLGRRMLDANGIEKRHYAIDRDGRTQMLNEELAEAAVRAALQSRGIAPRDIGMLATGTTQGDLPVPGFASMVHGRLGGGPMEVLSAGGVCCSGIAAMRAAEASVLLDRHRVAVAVGSEMVSRSLRASRFPDKGSFDAEFLRFMLSDGAGAVVIEDRPRSDGPSLRIDWSHLVSHAHRFPVCMYAGSATPDTVEAGATWQDQPTPADAHSAGMLNLRQDTAILGNIVALGVEEYIGLVRDGRIVPQEIDHLLVHYSSEYFRSDIVRLMSEAGLMIPEDRWFTNLRTKGNTGSRQHLHHAGGGIQRRTFLPRRPHLVDGPRIGKVLGVVRPPHLCRPADSGAHRGSLRSLRQLARLRMAARRASSGLGTIRDPAVQGSARGPHRDRSGNYRRLPRSALQPATASQGGRPLDHTGCLQPHLGAHRAALRVHRARR